MDITVLVRTLNEEKNIANFCEGYGFADRILIADGGSIDSTIARARDFPKAEIRDFTQQIKSDCGNIANPQGGHIDFLLDWSKEYNTDWLIFDDCDCYPYFELRLKARPILREAKEPIVKLYRLYMWGDDMYFPKYNTMGGHSLWAWKPDEVPFSERGFDFDNNLCNLPVISDTPAKTLNPPFVCLHYFTKDLENKKRRYRAWGYLTYTHPLDSIYAPPEPLPEWFRKESD